MQRPLYNLKGKVALVTGAGSGIGRATTLALANAGARLIVSDVNPQSLSEIAETLSGREQLVMSQSVDVADRAAMGAFAEAVHKQVPALDVLVNNAGVGLGGGILSTPLESFDWVMSINFFGVVHGSHYFIPKMVERGQGGHVVNVASLAGLLGDPLMLGYTASKYAVVGMSECMRAELATHRIGVSAICPGFINTPIVKNSRLHVGEGRDHDKEKARAVKFWEKRNYPPEKVADAIVDAIEHNRAIVPVAPEAWVFWFLKRTSPHLAYRIGRALRNRTWKGGP